MGGLLLASFKGGVRWRQPDRARTKEEARTKEDASFKAVLWSDHHRCSQEGYNFENLLHRE